LPLRPAASRCSRAAAVQRRRGRRDERRRLRRFGAQPRRGGVALLDWSALAGAGARRSITRGGGHAFARAASAGHAEAGAARLARSPPAAAQRAGAIANRGADADVAARRARERRSRRRPLARRRLRRLLAALFALLPAAIATLGGTTALLAAPPFSSRCTAPRRAGVAHIARAPGGARRPLRTLLAAALFRRTCGCRSGSSWPAPAR
jgi:hypothetical protein